MQPTHGDAVRLQFQSINIPALTLLEIFWLLRIQNNEYH